MEPCNARHRCDARHRLDKTSLTEQAAEAIKRQILTQHLQAGDRLPSERQLCGMLGISRSILREALSVLAGQKIVIKVPGKGVFVADFDRRSLGVDIRMTVFQNPEVRGALTSDISKASLALLGQVVDALRRGDVCQAQRAMKAHVAM
jgi:DNA-binding FadR family transcriptional regulator